MNRGFLGAAAALGILISGQAFAQSTTVVVSPEQRTAIKQYVVKEKIRPVTVREKLAVGVKVPADVELVAVPSAWGPSFSRYRYIYSDDRVMFVDPGTRAVVSVVD